METQPTRISKYVIDEIREIGKEIGEPTDDTIFRHLLAEYKRLKIENGMLKKELAEKK
jgi:hypothetical protein